MNVLVTYDVNTLTADGAPAQCRGRVPPRPVWRDR